MINRKYLVLIAVVAMLAIAGCAGVDDTAQSQEQSEEDISESTGDDVSEIEVGGSYSYEIKATEKRTSSTS